MKAQRKRQLSILFIASIILYFILYRSTLADDEEQEMKTLYEQLGRGAETIDGLGGYSNVIKYTDNQRNLHQDGNAQKIVDAQKIVENTYPFDMAEKDLGPLHPKICDIPIGSSLPISLQDCHPIITDSLTTTEHSKYFKEIERQGHLDMRFGVESVKSALFYDNHHRSHILKRLLAAWSMFCDEREIPYNIAHGTLLAWFWGQKLMDFDCDIDVQVPDKYLRLLSKYSNQTYYQRYYFDMNPFHKSRTSNENDQMNVIDARFIDQESGFYIDITGLSNLDLRDDVVIDKSPHAYPHSFIYPLIRTTLDGIPVWRPNDVHSCLTKEFDYQLLPKSFQYKHYRFNPVNRRWEKLTDCLVMYNAYIKPQIQNPNNNLAKYIKFDWDPNVDKAHCAVHVKKVDKSGDGGIKMLGVWKERLASI